MTIVRQTNYASASPRASPMAAPLVSSLLGGVVGLGLLGAFGYALFSGLLFVAAWAPTQAVALLQSVGVAATPAQISAWALTCFFVLCAFMAFEFCGRLDNGHPLRRIWLYWDTLRRTTLDSILKPALIGLVIGAVLAIALAAIFAQRELSAAWSSQSLGAFATGAGARVVGAAVALAALAIGLRSLADYFFNGQGFLAKALAKQVPRGEALAAAPPADLRFYHGVLRFAGAVSFACELLFQTAVFGLVSWGAATAFPQTQMFSNPAMLTPASAILFWMQSVFALVDGPNVFGTELSPLKANPHIWAFGVTIIFFKLFVISLIVRLFQSSLHLRPKDISSAWAEALERQQAKS